MRKIQSNVVYKCSFCEFTDASPKVVGRHEFSCVHNPKSEENVIEKARRQERQDIYESKDLKTANDLLIPFLKKYYPKEVGSSTTEKNFLLSVEPYQNYYGDRKSGFRIKCYYATILSRCGFDLSIENFVHLNQTLADIKDLEEKSVEYIKTYKEDLYKAEDEIFYKDEQVLLYKYEIQTLEEQIKVLSNKKYKLDMALKLKLQEFNEEFKNNYKFIDYTLLIREKKHSLGLSAY